MRSDRVGSSGKTSGGRTSRANLPPHRAEWPRHRRRRRAHSRRFAPPYRGDNEPAVKLEPVPAAQVTNPADLIMIGETGYVYDWDVAGNIINDSIARVRELVGRDKVLLVTSGAPQEGKSSVVAELDVVVTDDGITDRNAKTLEAAGVRLIIA